MLKKLRIKLKNLKKKVKLGCLGLTFKPNVDDVRESPALYIVEELIKEKIKVICCDPNLKQTKNIKLFSLKETILKSDLIIILVAHNDFKNLNFDNINFIDFSGYT